MGLTRRQFAARATTLLAAILACAWGAARASPPARAARKIRARLFPGRVVSLDHQKVGRPGPWAG